MKKALKRRNLCRFVAVAMAVGLLASCGNNNVSDEEIAELQARYDSIVAQYETLRSGSDEFSGEMQEKDSTILAQASEIETLIAQLKAAKGGMKTVVKEVDNSKQYKEQLAASKEELKAQKAQLKEKESQLKQVQKQLDKQLKELKQLQEAAQSTSTNDKTLANQIAKQQQQAAQQEKRIAELNSEITRLNGQIDKLNGQVTTLNGKNEALTSTNNGLASQNTSLTAQIATLNKEMANAKSQLSSAQSQLETVKGQLATAQQGNSNAATTTTHFEQTITKLRTQLKDCEAKGNILRNESAQLTAKIEGLNSEVAKLQQEKVHLEGQLAKATSTTSAATTDVAMQNKVNDLERQLSVKNSLIAQKESQIEKLTAQLSQKESQLTTLTDKVQQSEEQFASLRLQITSLTQQLQEKDQQIAKLSSAQSTSSTPNTDYYTTQIADLQGRIAEQQEEITRLQGDVMAKTQELETTRRSLSEAQRNVANVANSGASSAVVIKGTVNEKIEALRELCDSYAAEVERLRAENAQLKSENSQLKENMENIQKDAAKALTENAKLAQKVSLASVLVTTDLNVATGKAMNGPVAIKPTEKAKDTKVVRIEGKILDNNVIDPGTITLYARIANANNRVVTNNASNTFDLGGIAMQYTTKQDIEFTGYSRKVTMIWKKSDNVELTPGLYWVTLYANGYEIGKTSFTLK